MDKQVDKSHYNFESYCSRSRWVSYYWQLKTIFDKNPDSILEVGVGDKVLGNYIRQNSKISYTSLDVAEDLDPDILGDICDIPLAENSVDLVCAFEVLEHIPYNQVDRALEEVRRITRDYVIISLPHYGSTIKFSFKIPLIKEVKVAWKIPRRGKHKFNGEHYWEVGKDGYEIGKIKNKLNKHFTLKKDFLPYENQSHHFFILKKQ